MDLELKARLRELMQAATPANDLAFDWPGWWAARQAEERRFSQRLTRRLWRDALITVFLIGPLAVWGGTHLGRKAKTEIEMSHLRDVTAFCSNQSQVLADAAPGDGRRLVGFVGPGVLADCRWMSTEEAEYLRTLPGFQEVRRN